MNNNAALLAARGLKVFELAPGEKYPRDKGWQDAATDDPLIAAEIPVGSNIGVATSGLFVVDIDAGKGGLESLDKLRSMGEIPHTFTVRSARGGLHLYFRSPTGEKFRTRNYRQIRGDKGEVVRTVYALEGFRGVDTRAEGGLAVGPGSYFAGLPYSVEIDAPIADLPEWLATMARQSAPRVVASAGAAGPMDQPGDVHRAIAYVMTAAPSIEGNGGDSHLITVANRVMDFGISPDKCAEILDEHWDYRCLPPWGIEAIIYKCRSAAASRQDPIGRDNWDHAFAEMEPIAPPPKSAPALPTGGLLEFPDSIHVPDIVADQDRDIVKHLLSPGELSVLYGPSGGGKSFVAVHLAFAIALGLVWAGRKTRQVAVLYCAEEGLRGLRKRIAAATAVYGATGRHLARLRVPAFLARGEEGDQSVALIIKAVADLRAASGATDVVVIFDTLARAMAGEDENSVEAMMFVVRQRIGAVQRRTGAHCMAVHHTGKSGAIRGSTALYAAADCVLKLTDENGKRSVFAEKVKDDERGPLFDFSLKRYDLGRDSDGDEVVSCTVETTLASAGPFRNAEALAACTGEAVRLLEIAAASGEYFAPSNKARNHAGKELNARNPEWTAAQYDWALGKALGLVVQIVPRMVRGKETFRYVVAPRIA